MDQTALSINLIARDNGVGLSRDLQLLKQTLRGRNFEVTLTGIRGGKLTKWLRPPIKRLQQHARTLLGKREPRYDINVMLEHVRPQDLPFARHNVLIPNPEWFLPRDRAHLDDIDLILAKTRHAETLFRKLGVPVLYTGFTCCDRYDPAPRYRHGFFHLAGRSNAKGTERILQLWRKHPEWPLLTVVQNPRTARPGPDAANIDHRIGYFADDEIRRLQNEHRFHLCPSETEGYGHYLAEALTVGAIPITVDAPPMNELVSPECALLVDAGRTGTQHLATTYYFDETSMEQVVERALSMEAETLARMSMAARSRVSGSADDFGDRLEQALRSLCQPPKPDGVAAEPMRPIGATDIRPLHALAANTHLARRKLTDDQVGRLGT